MIDTWQPISIDELKATFKSADKPYWITGGWAIDLFLQKQTRTHEDLDVSIARDDQSIFQKLLCSWDLRASDPPGSGNLRKWEPSEILCPPIHNVWCRKEENGPWNLELMLCTFENGMWVYRRNSKIKGPLESFGWKQADGTLVIAPEIQLLYKSRGIRTKDTQDFENCLAIFNREKKEWLYNALLIDSGENHPWALVLKENI